MLQTMRSSAKFVFWILAVAFIGGFLLVETSGLLGSSPVTTTTAVASDRRSGHHDRKELIMTLGLRTAERPAV